MHTSWRINKRVNQETIMGTIFTPVFYYVTITDGGGLASAGDADGFYDPVKSELHAVKPTTYANSLKKERANMRYDFLIEQLSLRGNVVEVLDDVAVGSSGDNDPTAMNLTIVYDNPANVITEDELNPGTFLTGQAAVTRMAARSMLYDITKVREVFDPAANNSAKIERITAEALAPGASISAKLAVAEAQITSTEIQSFSVAAAVSGTIYDTSSALTANRIVTLSGKSLTFSGTSDAIINSDGSIQSSVFKFANSAGTQSISLRSPTGLTASYQLTLPANIGNNGDVLQSDGAGNAIWGAVGAATNFYGTDGTLSGARTVTMSGNNIVYSGTGTVTVLDSGKVQSTAGFELRNSANSQGITLSAPTGLSASASYIWPVSDGTNGQAMITDGAGNLSFASISSANNRLFADNTTVSPATAGAPTVAEINTFVGSNTDLLVYYTGTDTSTDTPTYVYWVDAAGTVTEIQSPSTSANFANSDLLLSATRIHNLSANTLRFDNASGFEVRGLVVNSDAASTSMVQIDNTTGNLTIARKDSLRALSGAGAPADGATIAWHIGQLYVDTTSDVTYYASAASTDPDSAGTGSTWVAMPRAANDRVFLSNTSVSPATAGAPTVAEITSAAGTNRNKILYYTGDDTSTNTPTYVYWIDNAGTVTQLDSPASATQTLYNSDGSITGTRAVQFNNGNINFTNAGTGSFVAQVQSSPTLSGTLTVNDNYVEIKSISSAVKVGAGIDVDISSGNALRLNGSSGAAEQVIASQGSALAPVWQDAGLIKRGSVTTNITAASSGIYDVDGSTASFTFTLPAALGSGNRIYITGSNVATNNVTVAVQAGQSLNGTTNGTEVISENGSMYLAIDRSSGAWEITQLNSAAAASIYTSDGTISTNRVVNISTNNVRFNDAGGFYTDVYGGKVITGNVYGLGDAFPASSFTIGTSENILSGAVQPGAMVIKGASISSAGLAGASVNITPGSNTHNVSSNANSIGGSINLTPGGAGLGGTPGSINISPSTGGNSADIAVPDLRFYDLDFSNYVGFKSPDVVNSDVVWRLPQADGTVDGSSMVTDTAGNLRFELIGLVKRGDLTITSSITNEGIYNLDSSSSPISITLPTATGSQARFLFIGKNVTSNTASVGVQLNDSINGTLNGLQNVTANRDVYLAIDVAANNWEIMKLNSAAADNLYTADGTLSGNRIVTLSGSTLTLNDGTENIVMGNNAGMQASYYAFNVSSTVYTGTAPAIDYTSYDVIEIVTTNASTGNVTMPAPTTAGPARVYHLVLSNNDTVGRSFVFNTGSYLKNDGKSDLGTLTVPANEKRRLIFVSDSSATTGPLIVIADNEGMPGVEPVIKKATGAVTLTADDYDSFVVVQSSAASQTVTLPDATTADIGDKITIYNNGSDDMTIALASGDSLIGSNIFPKGIGITVKVTDVNEWVAIGTGQKPAIKYTQTFITTDWTTGATESTLTIAATSHGKGTEPIFVEVWQDNGTEHAKVGLNNITRNDTSGDVTITVDNVSGAFNGFVVII